MESYGLAILTYVPNSAPPGTRRRLPAALTSLQSSGYAGPLFIIDDHSTDREHVNYLATLSRSATVIRRPVHGGIARAKNTCLRVLASAGITLGFLAEDDIRFSPGWLDAYLTAHAATGIHHFSWSWEHNPVGETTREIREIHGHPVVATNFLNGVFLTFTPTVLREIGGFKVLPAEWGHEHTHWTRRIVQAGLAPFFADILHSNRYIGLNEHAAYSAISHHLRPEFARKNLAAADELTPLFLPLQE